MAGTKLVNMTSGTFDLFWSCNWMCHKMCLAGCPMWHLATWPLSRFKDHIKTHPYSIRTCKVSSKSGWRMWANQPHLPSAVYQLPFCFSHCQLPWHSKGLSCSTSWMANFFLSASCLSHLPGSCNQQIEYWWVVSWWVFSILRMSCMDNEEHLGLSILR